MNNEVPTGKYAPLSPWAYWGLTILFSIPVVGLVFLIIFSINGKNINRRNFARSYWITLIPAVFMTFVVTSFILWAPHEFKLPQGFNLQQNVSYGLAAVIALGLGVMEVIRGRRMKEED